MNIFYSNDVTIKMLWLTEKISKRKIKGKYFISKTISVHQILSVSEPEYMFYACQNVDMPYMNAFLC